MVKFPHQLPHPLAPIKFEARCAIEPLWTFLRRKNICSHSQKSNNNYSVVQPTAQSLYCLHYPGAGIYLYLYKEIKNSWISHHYMFTSLINVYNETVLQTLLYSVFSKLLICHCVSSMSSWSCSSVTKIKIHHLRHTVLYPFYCTVLYCKCVHDKWVKMMH